MNIIKIMFKSCVPLFLNMYVLYFELDIAQILSFVIYILSKSCTPYMSNYYRPAYFFVKWVVKITI